MSSHWKATQKVKTKFKSHQVIWFFLQLSLNIQKVLKNNKATKQDLEEYVLYSFKTRCVTCVHLIQNGYEHKFRINQNRVVGISYPSN